MVWEKVYHTPVVVAETHNNGVDRTTIFLSTGGNEQDIDAMLKLYGEENFEANQKTDTDRPENDQKPEPNRTETEQKPNRNP